MTVKVKLLDRGLIRHFGNVVQDMNDDMAKRYVDQGKAKYDNSDYMKMESAPPKNKAIFQAPEDKAMVTFSTHRFPGPGDALFPKNIEG